MSTIRSATTESSSLATATSCARDCTTSGRRTSASNQTQLGDGHATGSPRYVQLSRSVSSSRSPRTTFAWRDASRTKLLAPQQGRHASEQDACAEGLGDVVVGAYLEPEGLVNLRVARRQEHERQPVARFAQAAAEREAVDVRHVHVAHDHVRAQRPDRPRAPDVRLARGPRRTPPPRTRAPGRRAARRRRRRVGGRRPLPPSSGRPEPAPKRYDRSGTSGGLH